MIEKKGFGNIYLNVVPDDVHVMPGVVMGADCHQN